MLIKKKIFFFFVYGKINYKYKKNSIDLQKKKKKKITFSLIIIIFFFNKLKLQFRGDCIISVLNFINSFLNCFHFIINFL